MLDQTSLQLLERTRLTSNEARVYLGLLQLGTATASEIAAAANLKRPTVYSLLEGLVASGYVIPALSGKVQSFTAADPSLIASELQQTTHDFQEMLPYLRAMQRKNTKPHISYFSGVEGLRRAFLEINRPREVCYLTSIAKMRSLLPQEVERWQRLYQKGHARPGGRHLLTDTPEDRAFAAILTNAGQIVRYLPQEYTLDMDIAIFDDRVVLATLEGDIHVLVVDSSAMFRSLVTLFELTWKNGRNG